VDGDHRLLRLTGAYRIHGTRDVRVMRRIRPRYLGLHGRLRSRLLRNHRIHGRWPLGSGHIRLPRLREFGGVRSWVGPGLIGRPMKYFI
jgi:hypothetical protein